MKHGCDQLPRPCGNGVDVRDVAEAQVKALVVPEASDRRFIVSLGVSQVRSVVSVGADLA